MPDFQAVDHDPFAPGPLLMPVDHDPFAGQPAGVTMDSDLSGLDPYETMKLQSQLATKGGYTPAQAHQNQLDTGMGLLYTTPIGNALSARDAMEAKWRGQELQHQGDTEGARRAFAEAAASAGMSFLPGMGRSGLARDVEGAASSTRIFAGPMAKTADHEALVEASRMRREGVNADQIWSATNWERHPLDDKWRFEIDDSAARMKENPPQIGTLGDFMEHPALFEAYPGLDKIQTMRFNPEMAKGTSAENALALYDPANEARPYPVLAFGEESLANKKIPLHEVQHAVQNIEGFTPGTSPSRFQESEYGPLADSIFQQMKERGANLSEDDMRANAQSAAKRELYKRTGGEVEARNVETRADLTADERANRAPWLTEDVYRMLQRNAPARNAAASFEDAANAQLSRSNKNDYTGNMRDPLHRQVGETIRQHLENDPDSYYGLRVTEQPLEVGKLAPASKNWYADFMGEDHPLWGREAFPDHGTDLPGPSVVGIRSLEDIDKALKAAALLPSYNYYPGNHISLIRGAERIRGADAGEWIIPDGQVVATWVKP